MVNFAGFLVWVDSQLALCRPMSPKFEKFYLSPRLKPRCQGRVMGFVGGGGNIAITSALPPTFCVLYCKHQIVYGISISYFLCLSEASVSGCGD